MHTVEHREWVNWSESLRFTPAVTAEPETEEELVELVRRAAAQGRTVRPAGAGHSSMPLMATDDILVRLDRMTGVRSVDSESRQGVLHAGTSLQQAGRELHEHGLALENYGDVDLQVLVGAIGTGTHGTGPRFGNFSSNLLGFRVVTGTGDVLDVGEEDIDLLRAGRVALGALGIFTELHLRLVASFRLRRREWCVPTDVVLDRLDELLARNRNFDFYWRPRRDDAQVRVLNEPDDEPKDLLADLDAHEVEQLRSYEEGWSFEVQPQERGLKFDEMEYALPAEAFRDCFDQARQRIMERHRQHVGWRVLCRNVAADDGYLSPFSGRESATIALLQNHTLPCEEYFADMEPLLRSHDGRPHFGKKHSARAAYLREAFPDFDRFGEVRRRLDPQGVFLNAHLRELLDPESGQ